MFSFKGLFQAISYSAFVFTTVVAAQGVQPDGSYTGGEFQNYSPYASKPVEKEKPKDTPKAVAPKTKDSAKEIREMTPREFGIIWEKTRDKAIMTGDPAWIKADIALKKIILDIASGYAKNSQEVMSTEPFFDESISTPTSTGGQTETKRIRFKAMKQGFEEMAKIGGLLVFVDSECFYCEQQLPALQGMNAEEFGFTTNNQKMEYLIVSLDGKPLKGMRANDFVKDTGLYQKLKLNLTPAIVYIPHPKGYTKGEDLNHYIVVSDGKIDSTGLLIERIVEVGIKAKIVDPKIAKAFNINERGSIKQKDLASLKIDPNKIQDLPDVVREMIKKEF